MATGLAAPAGRRIALIAHDHKQQDLLEWAEYNIGLLAGHELFASIRYGDVVLSAACQRSQSAPGAIAAVSVPNMVLPAPTP